MRVGRYAVESMVRTIGLQGHRRRGPLDGGAHARDLHGGGRDRALGDDLRGADHGAGRARSAAAARGGAARPAGAPGGDAGRFDLAGVARGACCATTPAGGCPTARARRAGADRRCRRAAGAGGPACVPGASAADATARCVATATWAGGDERCWPPARWMRCSATGRSSPTWRGCRSIAGRITVQGAAFRLEPYGWGVSPRRPDLRAAVDRALMQRLRSPEWRVARPGIHGQRQHLPGMSRDALPMPAVAPGPAGCAEAPTAAAYESYFATGAYDRRYPRAESDRAAADPRPAAARRARDRLRLRQRALPAGAARAGRDRRRVRRLRGGAGAVPRRHRARRGGGERDPCVLGPDPADVDRHVARHGPADLVLCLFGVLSHIEGAGRARADAGAAGRRCCGRGRGRLILSVPNRRRRFRSRQRALPDGAARSATCAASREGSVELPLQAVRPRRCGPSWPAPASRSRRLAAESLLPETAVARLAGAARLRPAGGAAAAGGGWATACSPWRGPAPTGARAPRRARAPARAGRRCRRPPRPPRPAGGWSASCSAGG